MDAGARDDHGGGATVVADGHVQPVSAARRSRPGETSCRHWWRVRRGVEIGVAAHEDRQVHPGLGLRHQRRPRSPGVRVQQIRQRRPRPRPDRGAKRHERVEDAVSENLRAGERLDYAVSLKCRDIEDAVADPRPPTRRVPSPSENTPQGRFWIGKIGTGRVGAVDPLRPCRVVGGVQAHSPATFCAAYRLRCLRP